MSARSILLLTRALDTGGAQRQLVELALGLQRAGWRVIVATFYPGGCLEAALRSAGVPIFSLDKRGRWDVLPFVWRLVTMIRRERPQFVKGYLVMSNVLLAALRPALGGARVVWGVAASDMDLRYYDLLSKIEFRLSIVLSRCADLIIANSEAGRRYHISRGYRADRMVVIPNGIDVEQFRREPRARAEVRAEWGIPPHAVLIGLVGRVDPMKDHANFLRAAAELARSRDDVRFVCVGPGAGAYRDEMGALGEALGVAERLIWAGERADIWRAYNALDLLVSSSRSEGLPNVVAEAMAVGVPCVVTDVGDSARIVGEYGWVCTPGDSQALARAMGAAIASLPADSTAIRHRICTEYSTAALVRRTTQHLGRLVSAASIEYRVAPD